MSNLFRKEIMAKKFHIHRILVAGNGVSNTQFYMPNNYKDCVSIFVLGNREKDYLGLTIASKEILPRDFNANLIAFTGEMSRNQVKYPLKLEKTASSLVKIEYKGEQSIVSYEVAIYFEVIE